MELKSTISDTLKLCTFGSLLGCLLLLLLFFNQSHHVSLSAARNTMGVDMVPLGQLDYNLHTTLTKTTESGAEPKHELEPEPKPSNSTTNSPASMTKDLEPEPSNFTTTRHKRPTNSPATMAKDPEPEPSKFTSPHKGPEPEPKPKLEPSNSTAEPPSTMIKGSLEFELESEPLNLTTKPPMEKVNTTTNPVEKSINKTGKKCDIFDGRWVYREESVPTYNSSVCPFLEEKMSCQKNGRPDSDYEKWTWEGRDCEIPLFNARDMLERLRNKRVIIVGDSLNRNQWESLACLIYSSIDRSRAMVDAEGPTYKVLKAKDYNVILEFYWSPFLINMDESHKSGRKVLVLDELSPSYKQWLGADVMVFNSGHWWTHHGKIKAWDLFQYEGNLVENLPIEEAYERAMKTWAKWVQTHIDPKKTTVFFRSISTEHKGNQWCYNSTQPITDESYKSLFPKSLIEIIERQIEEMNKETRRVKYLNITKLSGYRRDAHPSVYRSWRWKIYTQKYRRLIPSYADCSHWCLPGLPDTWNRLLYASLFNDRQDDTSIF